MSVTTAPTFTLGTRATVLDGLLGAEFSFDVGAAFDVTPDGGRFLGVVPVDEGMQVVVVTNWIQEMRDRLSGARSR